MEAYFMLKRSARVIYEEEEEEEEEIGSVPSCFSDDSVGSSSPSELAEDASSSNSPSSSSSSSSDGHLEMSSLMTQLPFKRGLSKFFDGKSQSFTSLAEVSSLEELAKPARGPERKRLKPSRSCGGGLDAHRHLSPRHCSKGAVGKKAAASARSPLSVLGDAQQRRRHGGFLGGAIRPLPPPATAAPARPEGVAGQTLLFA